MKGFVFVTLICFCFTSHCIIAYDDIISRADCEIVYEVIPHKNSARIIGEQLYGDISTLSWLDWKQLSQDESSRLENVLNQFPALLTNIRLGDTQIVQGGYEGLTNVSISLPISISESSRGEEIASLVSILGYIYYQDSVLVLCSSSQLNSAIPALIHELRDTGRKDYINSNSARLIYDMMIAYTNQSESIGYTYNEHKDSFWVLDFDLKEKRLKKILQKIATNLSDISKTGTNLIVQSSEVQARFMSNDWQANPNGQLYLEHIGSDYSRKVLLKEQEWFVNNLKNILYRRGKF